MSTILANPWALSLLAVLPVLSILTAIGRRMQQRRQARLGSPLALASLIEGSRGWPALRGLVLMLAISFWIVAIAGPQWGLDPQAAATSGRDLVVLIDVSRSMTADDVPGSRLEQAKKALIEMAAAVQRRGGHRLGLVAVAAQAQVICPLTQDFNHFSEKVAELNVDELAATLGPKAGAASGTRLGVGLNAAVAALDERFRQGQTVLMISDGDDPAGDGEWNAGIEAAQVAKVKVYTVGIGDPNKERLLGLRFNDAPVATRLHEEPLKAIARATQGEYIAAQTQPPNLGELFRARIEPGPGRDFADDLLPVYRQRYARFVGAALGLLAMGLLMNPGVFRKHGSKKPPTASRKARRWWFAATLVLVSAAPGPAPLDAVRAGNAAFDRGDFEAAVQFYEQAEGTATDPGLVAFNLATARFRLAEQAPEAAQRLAHYRAAELNYRSCTSDDDPARQARAYYGLGTCLLRRSDGQDRKVLEAAIDSFGLCLAASTDEALIGDARYNRELAKLLLLKIAAGTNPPGGDEPNPMEAPKTVPPTKPPEGSNDTRPSVDKVSPEIIKQEAGTNQKPIHTEMAPPPGSRDLPPVPNTGDPVKMSPEDAAAYLQLAAERVRQERREWLRRPVPPRPNVKDW